MKAKLSYVLTLMLFVTTLASAANYIIKNAAENIALNAVGGGTVIQAVLETEYQTRVWTVNITHSPNEYDVYVNAYTGKVMKITSQPQEGMISKQQAEATALGIAGKTDKDARNDYVVDSKTADQDEGGKGWLVTVQRGDGPMTISVDGGKATPIGLAQQFGKKVISKATAEKLALNALGGGTIVPPTLLEMNDRPAHWSVNVTQGASEFEVWVDAYTGKILNIIRG